MSRKLEDAIRGAMVNNRLPCNSAWEIADRSGFDIEDHTMVLYGLCTQCREQARNKD